MRKTLLGLASAAALAGGAQAAPRGAALVIGNSDYEHATDLNNPGNDARAVSEALRELGFEVIEARDADLQGMQAALSRFSAAIDPGEPAIVFYSGHGLQGLAERPEDGIDNYLVPVDARLAGPERLAAETMSLNKLLQSLETAGAGPRLVVLDACRNNPFARLWSGSQHPWSPAAGLAQPGMRALNGVYIAYATAPGSTASDGQPGTNGVFTRALLRYIRAPGLPVSTVFEEVSAEVARTTGGKQQPWFSGTGRAGRFQLRPSAAKPEKPAKPVAAKTDAVQEAIELNRVDAGGKFRIAAWYLAGAQGFPKNEREAVRWLREAAEDGDIMAALGLGHAYYEGQMGLPKDRVLAQRWLAVAARGGDVDAMALLAAMLIGDGGPRPDVADGVRWARLAAAAGSEDGMFLLASTYEHGAGGLTRDLEEAKRWYRRASDKGMKQAADALVRLIMLTERR